MNLLLKPWSQKDPVKGTSVEKTAGLRSIRHMIHALFHRTPKTAQRPQMIVDHFYQNSFQNSSAVSPRNSIYGHEIPPLFYLILYLVRLILDLPDQADSSVFFDILKSPVRIRPEPEPHLSA